MNIALPVNDNLCFLDEMLSYERQRLLKDIQNLRAFFTEPKLWTKGAEACSVFTRNMDKAEDHGVPYYSKSAKCYCLTGAARKLLRMKPEQSEPKRFFFLMQLLRETIQQSPWCDGETYYCGDAMYVASWNDDSKRTFAQIKGVLHRAEKRMLTFTPKRRLTKKAA
jgi:hypothetical protein